MIFWYNYAPVFSFVNVYLPLCRVYFTKKDRGLFYGHKIQKKSKIICKPNSVLGGYLSSRIVADTVKRYRRNGGQPNFLTSCTGWGLHCRPRCRGRGRLLPCLSSLACAKKRGRFISVALSLKLPSPVVSRHPVLWCSDFPHGRAAQPSDYLA